MTISMFANDMDIPAVKHGKIPGDPKSSGTNKGVAKAHRALKRLQALARDAALPQDSPKRRVNR